MPGLQGRRSRRRVRRWGGVDDKPGKQGPLGAVAWLAIAGGVLRPVLTDLVLGGGVQCPEAYRCTGLDGSRYGYRSPRADASMSS